MKTTKQAGPPHHLSHLHAASHLLIQSPYLPRTVWKHLWSRPGIMWATPWLNNPALHEQTNFTGRTAAKHCLINSIIRPTSRVTSLAFSRCAVAALRRWRFRHILSITSFSLEATSMQHSWSVSIWTAIKTPTLRNTWKGTICPGPKMSETQSVPWRPSWPATVGPIEQETNTRNETHTQTNI